MTVLFVVSLVLAAFASTSLAAAAGRAGLRRTPVFLVAFPCLLYAGSLLPGAAGALNGAGVYTATALLSLLAMAAARLSARGRGGEMSAPGGPSPPWTPLSSVVLVAGSVLSAPVALLFLSLPESLGDQNLRLPWDTVSYHLPALVEFVQKESLWSLDGPYQSYSFAFELIAGYGTYLFPSHAGMVIANAYGVLLLAAALHYLVGVFLRDPASGTVHPLALTSLVLGFWSVIYGNKLTLIGMNDIFQGGCVLMAAAFLFDLLADESTAKGRRTIALVASASALGLAFATKPTALAYIPFALFALAWSAAPAGAGPEGGTLLRRRLPGEVALTLLVVTALGGFFLARNLLAFGSINPTLADGWKWSLAANIGNAALFQVKPGSAVFAAAVVTWAAWVPAILSARAAGRRRLLLFGFLFFGFSLLAFALTPLAVFHHTTAFTTWKLRLGMVAVTFMVLSWGLAAGRLADLDEGGRGKWLRRALPAVAAGLLALVLARGHYLPLAGLPGYGSPKGADTDIYDWAQSQEKPLRIYAAGLRPYGLYGKRWQHTVFYDLHSTILNPPREGQKRLAAIVDKFDPDIMIIGLDPHPYSPDGMPPVVDWMRGREDCFQVLREDDGTVLFRCRVECGAILRRELGPQPEARMGG